MVKAPQGFKESRDVVYQPRRVPRYTDFDQDIDGEDMSFNFKSGKAPKQPMEPMTELHGSSGRLPDEFHNVEFEMHHREMVQPTHYDEYDPKVEGFFGAGYSMEPHYVEEHHERRGTGFTPGHFSVGDLEHAEDYHAHG